MASTGLGLLRVYCKSRPYATEGKGRGDRQQQGTSDKPKTVSISDGTPADDRIPADRKTTGQRRFWKIGSVGITKLHISSVQTGLGISFARVTVVSKLFGGEKQPTTWRRTFPPSFGLSRHFSFFFFFWHSCFFPHSPLRCQSLSGWEPNHALSSCGLHAFQAECSRWKPFFPPLVRLCVHFCFKLLDEDYEKIQTPVARDDLMSKYTLTQVTFLQFWS